MKLFSMQSTARVLLLALAYLLAACGVASTGSASPTSGPIASATSLALPTQPGAPTAAPTASLPATAEIAPTAATLPTAISQAGVANLLISYHKSGGIAGVNETISVYADGTIELSDKGGSSTAKADPSAMQALQKLLASPEFAALQVPVSPPGADQFVYELTVAGHPKPIVTSDNVDNPAVLNELIGALEQMKTPAK